MSDNEDLTQDFGVSKDIEKYPDLIGRQIYQINQLLSFGGRNQDIEDAIKVLEAILSPYMPVSYKGEVKTLIKETTLKMRVWQFKDRFNNKERMIKEYYVSWYEILLRHAKEKGFLPRTLKWE